MTGSVGQTVTVAVATASKSASEPSSSNPSTAVDRVHRPLSVGSVRALVANCRAPIMPPSASLKVPVIRYGNTTVYYGIHERSECIPVPVDISGVTNLIHDRRSCVDFTLEVRRMWLDVSTQA